MKPAPLVSICLALSLVAACQNRTEPVKHATGSGSTTAGPGSGSGSGSGSAAPVPSRVRVPDQDITSKAILARTKIAPEVAVKQVLLAWADLLPVYRGRLDPRAAKRTNADAAALAKELLAKIAADPGRMDALIQQHSEDPGSLSGSPYTVADDSQFVPEFKNLALRLAENEAGIVRTQYGYHVILRVPPPPPDPLESTAILARPEKSGDIEVQHILIGWKDLVATGDPRAKRRTKAEADKLVTELLAQVKAGADMTKLMKLHSEDPGSKDSGRAYEVSKDSPLVGAFKKLSLRLDIGEAGLVKTELGWHLIKRVPPDSLNSSAIFARDRVTDRAKVKHILLGWTAANVGDERGKQRTRPELEKLVKATVAKLKRGAKIEPLMKQLSEDSGSAATGEPYEVTPSAGLVAPFKNLALRLRKGEVGVVKTQFGIHIIQRVE